MEPVEWYYARGNQQIGPVSPQELKRLAMSGQLQPHDLVWRTGMTGWTAASNVRGLFEGEPAEAPKSPPPEPAPQPSTPVSPVKRKAAHLFDAVLDFYRPVFNERFISATNRVLQACGSWGLMAAVLLYIVLTVMLAVQDKISEALFSGAIVVFALLALQYLTGKFCKLLEDLSRTLPGRLSSAMLPDCVAVAAKTLGVILLLTAIAAAVQSGLYDLIPAGAAALLVFSYLAILAMNPAALNISIGGEQSPGEEALGIATFGVQLLLRAAPAAFGFGVLSGVVLLVIAGGQILLAGNDYAALTPAKMTLLAGRYSLYLSSLAPLATYLGFVCFALLLNLCEGILVLRTPPADRPTEKKPDQP